MKDIQLKKIDLYGLWVRSILEHVFYNVELTSKRIIDCENDSNPNNGSMLLNR